MTWLFGLIWLPLAVCFGLGVLLSTVWWGWRRRAIHAEYEKRRLAAEAESDRLRLRVSSLKVSETRADDLQLELEKAQTDSKKVPALERELRELRLQIGLVTELENQITNLRSRADQADQLERRVAELEGHLDASRRTTSPGTVAEIHAGEDGGAGGDDVADGTDDGERDEQASPATQDTAGRDDEATVIDLTSGSARTNPPDGEESSEWSTADSGVGASGGATQGKSELGLLPVTHEDDLKVIMGIGPSLQSRLNGIGIRSWEQIAALSDEQLESVGRLIAIFPGRISRDRWVEQAADLVTRYPSVEPYDRPTKETIKKAR